MILDLFRKEVEFEKIQGYDDLKDIVRRALDAEDNYNLLFIGPPASAKTLFLLGILESKKGVYFDGSNTTNRILDVLEEKRAKIICIITSVQRCQINGGVIEAFPQLLLRTTFSKCMHITFMHRNKFDE